MKRNIVTGVLFSILLTVTIFFGISNSQPQEDFTIGASSPGSQWKIFDRFTGFRTKSDPSKVPDGANSQGQNTIVNNRDRISVRDKGYELFPSGTATTAQNRVTSMHTFRKRNGTNILMRSSGTIMEYYHEDGDVWETLNSGYTADQAFGYGDFNINTDLVSYVYFGNGQEAFTRWSGAITGVNGALSGGEGTIVADDTSGFDANGTIVVCATNVTYTGKTATSFTGAVSTPACDDNRGITQQVVETAANPRGNIYTTFGNRLFITGSTSTPQAVFFSKYGDADTFTTTTLVTDTTAEDSGIFNLAEGGGGVIAMTQDENALYMFKRSIIYKSSLSDSRYSLVPLKPFDGKSQTTGAVTNNSTFAGGNGIFFITPDRQIMNLTRIDTVDYPQIIPISDPIEPTIEVADFASSTGIYWQDKAYIAAKTTKSSAFNDVVFVYNFRIQAWDSPIVGWNVGDWAIYDDGNGEELYFGDSITQNTYKVTTIPLDDIHGVSANWRSGQVDFGLPHKQKDMENVFIEGYVADNTTITISLLLDDNGYTQVYTTEFAGTESDYIYDSPEYNVFGFNAFGTSRFGVNDDESGLKKFRIYLNKEFRRVPFYSAQIEFATDGENAQWEILRYGFEVREHSQPLLRKLFRAFN